MKILFLMGGHNLDLKNDYPLYMYEIDQKMILELLIDYSKTLNPDLYIFCVKQEHIKKYCVDDIIRRKVDNSICIEINNQTKGALCTAMLASDFFDDDEIIVLSIDDFTDENWYNILSYFRNNNSDAGIVSFKSVHPRYAFAILDENDNVTEISVKKPLSNNALCSFFYFKNSNEFFENCKKVLLKNNPINGLFYISQVLNEMILSNKNISIYNIEQSSFHSIKNEKQIAQYILELKENK